MLVPMGRVLRISAAVLTALVLVGFVTFAVDEARAGSQSQVQKLGEQLRDPAPSAQTEALRERRHGSLREMIDDANDLLLAPFTGVVDSDNEWVRRGVPTALALLAYGFGLSFLANLFPARSHRGRDWRVAR